MLRRFNSLIKGPKGDQVNGDELSDLHVSLQPALSVDSSLFISSQHHYINPLQQQLARAREEVFVARARSTRASSESKGQTSSIFSLLQERPENHQQGDGRANGHGFVNGRVAEENLGKEGYEHGNQLRSSPSKPPEARDQTNTEFRDEGSRAAGAQPQVTFRPVDSQVDAARVLRTSTDAVVAAERTSSRSDLPTIVDIPDAQPGNSVDLETLRKTVTMIGPGRTFSSWSTDSAAEHCRICQQNTEEPLIELGCACRGEISKSHKSCIEMWFKNKGTNNCEVCQHVASNIPALETSPSPHFWVWRLGGAGQTEGAQAGIVRRVGVQRLQPIVNRPVLLMIIKKHPLIPIMWLGLLAFMTYLFVDSINTSTIGYAAMPIGFLFGLRAYSLSSSLGDACHTGRGPLFDVLIFIFLGVSALPVNMNIGVLVVLGLGTAVRLVLEYLQERNVRRNIRLMEFLEHPANEEAAERGD